MCRGLRVITLEFIFTKALFTYLFPTNCFFFPQQLAFAPESLLFKYWICYFKNVQLKVYSYPQKG